MWAPSVAAAQVDTPSRGVGVLYCARRGASEETMSTQLWQLKAFGSYIMCVVVR